ncbi:MAG: 2-hydroxymuconate tautomerase family protein [Tepidisphaera sp.]
MPYVSIKITSEPKATSQQRAQLISMVTDALAVTLDKDPETTFVVIEEISSESWGLGGEPVASRRARAPRPSAERTDAKAIAEVVEKYFEGIYRGDVALLRAVFHPEARLWGFAPADPAHGELPERVGIRSLDEYLKAVASRVSPQARGEPMNSRILSVSCEGPLALVRAFVPMLGYSYLDHLELVRDSGTWRISHKQFAHGVGRFAAGSD